MRVPVATQAGFRACLRMDAFRDVASFVAVAGTAIYCGGMLGMRIILNGRVAIGAVQAPMHAGLLFRPVYIDAVACLVCERLFAVTDKAFSTLLRTNRRSSKSKEKYGR
jgi:hypothetical protein